MVISMKVEIYSNGDFVREVSSTFPNCVEIGKWIIPLDHLNFYLESIGFENPSWKIKGDKK